MKYYVHSILFCMQGHNYVLQQVAKERKLKRAVAKATKTHVAKSSPLKSRGSKGKKNKIHPYCENVSKCSGMNKFEQSLPGNSIIMIHSKSLLDLSS